MPVKCKAMTHEWRVVLVAYDVIYVGVTCDVDDV